MIPTINTMMVVGIVSLPGMMTGQIIAGMEPTQAVLYQIVIMFLTRRRHIAGHRERGANGLFSSVQFPTPISAGQAGKKG